VALSQARVYGAHRDTVERLDVGTIESNPPVAAVQGVTEDRVGATERVEGVVQQVWSELWGIHADQQGWISRVEEGGPQSLVESFAALGHDLESLREPAAGLAVERQYEPGRSAGECRRECVLESGKC